MALNEAGAPSSAPDRPGDHHNVASEEHQSPTLGSSRPPSTDHQDGATAVGTTPTTDAALPMDDEEQEPPQHLHTGRTAELECPEGEDPRPVKSPPGPTPHKEDGARGSEPSGGGAERLLEAPIIPQEAAPCAESSEEVAPWMPMVAPDPRDPECSLTPTRQLAERASQLLRISGEEEKPEEKNDGRIEALDKLEGAGIGQAGEAAPAVLVAVQESRKVWDYGRTFPTFGSIISHFHTRPSHLTRQRAGQEAPVAWESQVMMWRFDGTSAADRGGTKRGTHEMDC